VHPSTLTRWIRPLGSTVRRIPLRVKLVVLMSGLVTGALLLTGLAASTEMRRYLMNRVDGQLTTAARVISSQVDRHPPGSPPGNRGSFLNTPSDDPTPADCATSNTAQRSTDTLVRLPSDYWVQTADVRGTPTGLNSNPLNLNECGPVIPTLAVSAVQTQHGKPFSVPSRHGQGQWRVIVLTAPNGNGSVAVATPLTAVGSTLAQLARFELIIGGIVLVVLAGLGYVAVRRSLRPLIDVEHTAAAIAAGDLTRRVPESDPRTEVGKLSVALNGMLSQIETAFRAREASEREARTSEDRMRRFITDASHELRTPLTSIRGFAELYRIGAVAQGPDIDRVMGRIEGESTRMSSLVDDLLLLARLDQQRPLDRDLIDLRTVAADVVHDAQALAPARDVHLEDLSGGRPVVIIGDDARLRQVVGNLMANALTHTPDSAMVTVRVDVRTTDGRDWAVVEVADDGPGLTPDDARRVFERFYRVEASRTRAPGSNGGGSGLGLSIVAALTAAHGGTVDLDTAPGKGSTFRITLPLADVSKPLADVAKQMTESADTDTHTDAVSRP
jgi:two-component system, OmpR family, sensor kinase